MPIRWIVGVPNGKLCARNRVTPFERPVRLAERKRWNWSASSAGPNAAHWAFVNPRDAGCTFAGRLPTPCSLLPPSALSVSVIPRFSALHLTPAGVARRSSRPAGPTSDAARRVLAGCSCRARSPTRRGSGHYANLSSRTMSALASWRASAQRAEGAVFRRLHRSRTRDMKDVWTVGAGLGAQSVTLV